MVSVFTSITPQHFTNVVLYKVLTLVKFPVMDNVLRLYKWFTMR